ncbi:hypothetical protein [Phreatobacter stygius]|uniref:Phage holin family protein n=1 Tax=Phreatobacter stygius TaxID=1940610 RepID=A0A4D7B2K0_9HYPH|nr:hypothetical protein [Phreatobacter stygius]QCI67784.1 hypothetical protein E8M01_28305 [Phreatobacter stygius]
MFKVLGALAMSEAGQSIRKSLVVHGLYVVAILIGVVACGFALAGLYTMLALRYDAVVASLVIAAGLFVVALVIFAIAAFMQSRPRRSNALATTALVAAPIAASALGSKNTLKVAALGGIVLLGAALGRQLGR